MRLVLLLALGLAACTASPPSAPAASTPADTAPRPDPLAPVLWLAGTWRGEAEGVPFHETWARVNDTLLIRQAYRWCGPDTTGTGITRLWRRADGRFSYGRFALSWTSTTAAPGHLVLENPDLAESQRLVFRQSPEGGLIADRYTNTSLTRQALAPAEPLAARLHRPVAPLTGTFEGYTVVGRDSLPSGVRFTDGYVYLQRDDGDDEQAGPVCRDGAHVRFPFEAGRADVFFATLSGDTLSGRTRVGRTWSPVRLVRTGQ